MLKSASNETILAYEIPNIIDEENVIIVVGQGKAPVLILSGNFWKNKTFLILFLKLSLIITFLKTF